MTIKVTVAWWLPLYLWAIKWFYVVTGKEPDWDKVGRVVMRGMSVAVPSDGMLDTPQRRSLLPGERLIPASQLPKPSSPPMQDEYYGRR